MARELAALDRMTAAELRDTYAAVFGEPAEPAGRATAPVPAVLDPRPSRPHRMARILDLPPC